MTKLITPMATKNFINKSVIAILLLVNALVSSNAIAQERTSISYEKLSKNLSTDSRITLSKEIKTTTTTDQNTGKATGKTRTEMREATINTKRTSNKALKPTALTRGRSNIYSDSADFSIYGATVLLQEDYDNDGFYQTFSVIFDADLISYTENQLGEVYALLYISKNGGPWTHYYTTDNFLIEGDTDLDEYEVMTTFLSGYSPDYYDILIDLYQEGYSDIVASYSSDDSNSLYALSLESADYNKPYIDVNHGGSFSISLILLFLLVYSLRLINKRG